MLFVRTATITITIQLLLSTFMCYLEIKRRPTPPILSLLVVGFNEMIWTDKSLIRSTVRGVPALEGGLVSPVLADLSPL